MTGRLHGIPGRWTQAWPDALAFAGGLAFAWFGDWNTTDLVWSLWLSSLLVGYAMLIWSIVVPAVMLQRAGRTGAMAPVLGGGLFMVIFFTIHFGMFHLVHSVFLNSFFPVEPATPGFLSLGLYAEVFARYWPFVLTAALAERRAFRLDILPPVPLAVSVKAAGITHGKERNTPLTAGTGMMAPYKNVMRLHLLIFFFAAAHFAKLDNFLVYAVVYAVYFFPWRLVRKG